MAIISEQHKQWMAEDLDYHTFLNVISDLCPLNETVSENDACDAHLYHDLFSCLLHIYQRSRKLRVYLKLKI